ncbi:MAG: LysR family transcriptional regulator [Gammaproteobacteria bacterium]|nr:LysR family transcriptional regulator [Gammaproteobacteria bacterium]
MDFNGLSAFIAVAEQGSFSLAAEQLHLTQPAVSKRVATLENGLGTRLFDRVGRHIDLTEAGRQLLPRARHLLLELTDIHRSLTNLSREITGTLTMATSHHIGLHRLPPILKQFSLSHPEVKLDIRFMDSESACAAVAHGELELAIVTLPTDPLEHLETRLIWDDELCFVVSREHPLAARTSIDLSELLQHPGILAATGTYTREILERAIAPTGLKIDIGMATNYLETLKMLVSIGLGWSLLPKSMLKEQNLILLNIPEMRLKRRLGSVIHQRRTLSNAAQAMLDLCG